ncbi:hypothetical protein PR202_ga27342 [Eleusine coracana subsp. coracana]|uniref:LysM domain-containing protein n=1 Tax=Eleusine coracana subsp. coracana TaxID=191504 RepID=A0AAV5DGW3_ELECO|nr:hypothetical protein QOZ80_3AG0230720 [Eleusine coracana subsp. coracana]GJN09342.1 hypothetical protein PR202_ga27342 [Eleusine coracana subsp. coracana]
MGVKQVLVHRNARKEEDDDDDGSSSSSSTGSREGAPLEVDQSPSPPPMSSCGRYILHRVCRFDTLAGVAIKYGVEVADVKRVNGLTTDLQMFAHKTLRIPLPGRHPPATPSPPPYSSSSSSSPTHAADRNREWTTRRPPRNAASLDPFLKPPRSAIAPSMSLLQGYYGLPPAPKVNLTDDGTEMTACTKGLHRKARSLSDGFSIVNGDPTREVDDSEKPIRRRQKADYELTAKEDNASGLPARAGQRLALRPKSGSRPEMNNGSQQDLVAAGMLSYMDGLQSVRKSSSTPEFQDADNTSIASVWLRSTWSLKPDAFTLPLPLFDGIPKPLLDSIPKPFFDSISNPIAAWRNKAAKD